MMKETQFLGTLLPSHPDIRPIIQKIREKYGIPEIVSSDGLKEILLFDHEIDWEAMRRDLEKELRQLSGLLPPELALYHKIIELNENLPAEPTFTEPITEKLKADVLSLYHAYVHVHGLLSNIVASPWKTAIDNIFSGTADNLLEFLMTGEAREVPNDWLSAVFELPIFGENVVMAMASQLTDPAVITEQFREQLTKSYGKHRPTITKTNLSTAEYLAMKWDGMKLIDIADEYIQSHRLEFPKDEESDDYKAAKRKVEEMLKQRIRRAEQTFDAIVGDKNPQNSVP